MAVDGCCNARGELPYPVASPASMQQPPCPCAHLPDCGCVVHADCFGLEQARQTACPRPATGSPSHVLHGWHRAHPAQAWGLCHTCWQAQPRQLQAAALAGGWSPWERMADCSCGTAAGWRTLCKGEWVRTCVWLLSAAHPAVGAPTCPVSPPSPAYQGSAPHPATRSNQHHLMALHPWVGLTQI